ncbi:MAG: hypothetical protein GTO30_13535, partial [Acidobacteria bacterium]|nr:hypothetical protein [Acidobacteriota bacterium]NIO60751.1 hypothetical protein [Acidobacteriota bacterium]NIQ87150.1 hypothetical protein [Acidobacteriota bacterium]
MLHLGGRDYEATLPGGACDATPQFYVSIEGDGGTTVTDPSDAPGGFFQTSVGTIVTEVSDDFETDAGWTVENGPGLSAGSWERGVPVGGGDRGDPPTDFDGSGQCWLTQNGDGDTDVDGGMTLLISPTYDVSAIDDPAINFALFYTNFAGAGPNEDVFNVYLSDDNGSSWTLAATYGPAVSLSVWLEKTLRISDFVTPNSQVRIRFEASDLINGSIVEAGVDAL